MFSVIAHLLLLRKTGFSLSAFQASSGGLRCLPMDGEGANVHVLQGTMLVSMSILVKEESSRAVKILLGEKLGSPNF